MTIDQIAELRYSDEYSDYILTNGCNTYRLTCYGDMLLEAMEDGYLFEEFLASKGINNAF